MVATLHNLTASEALNYIKKCEISIKEYVQECLDQISRLEPRIHAWAYLDEDKAILQAKLLDKKIKEGAKLGKLCGICVGVKDIFNTSDMPTEMGSKLWRNFTPGNDARVVFYLRQADAIIPGKTVTAEFGVHFPGPTVNPFNFKHTPGTSSSGSAAAVATYMVPLALGSQTAGSTLRPASYCGIYGFKPSFGLVPRTGMLKTTDTLDHVGLLTRSVEDLGLLFDTIRVGGQDYPLVQKYLEDPKRQEKKDKIWRVAFVQGPKWKFVEEYAKRAMKDYVNKLAKDKEIVVESLTLPDDFFQIHNLHEQIYDKALSYYFQAEVRHSKKLSQVFYDMIRRGQKISLENYQKNLRQQQKFVHHLDRLFAHHDIIITLTTGGEALPGLESIDRPDTCLIWTFCGVPSMSLPVFIGPNNLPYGVQIVARKYNDYLLLKFAHFLTQKELSPKKAVYFGKLRS